MVDVKRLAAEILRVGESRVKISPKAVERLDEVITKNDVRALIGEGLIWAEAERGVSRGRWRIRHIKKKKGRRRGHGSRKGRRIEEEEVWKSKIRAMRQFINYLKKAGKIEPATWRKLYKMVKGNYFRDLDHLKIYINEHKLTREPLR